MSWKILAKTNAKPTVVLLVLPSCLVNRPKLIYNVYIYELQTCV